MVARYVIPEVNGMLDDSRESHAFVIENRGTWERNVAAVEHKIRANERALAAAEVDEAQGKSVFRWLQRHR